MRVPLSISQENHFFVEMMGGRPDSHRVSNMAVVQELKGELDDARLASAASLIIERHEVFRTVFDTENWRHGALVLPKSGFEPAYLDASVYPEVVRAEKARQAADTFAAAPFDLSVSPLCRLLITRLSTDTFHLLFVVHHIAFDARSLGIFFDEISSCYQALAVATPTELIMPGAAPVQHTAFAAWQRKRLELRDTSSYWSQQLDNASVLELPCDFPRRSIKRFEGSTLVVTLDPPTCKLVAQWARAERCTPFMVLLTALYVTLAAWSGSSDVSVCTPIADRSNKEFSRTIGYLVNVIVLRIHINPAASLTSALHYTRTLVADGYRNSLLSYERVMHSAVYHAKPGYPFLSQVLFGLMSAPPLPAFPGILSFAGVTSTAVPLELNASRLDLAISAAVLGDSMAFVAEFDTDLFTEQTISSLMQDYFSVLRALPPAADDTIDALATRVLARRPRWVD